jgi:hypothetical protein
MKLALVLALPVCAFAQEYKNLDILKGMPPERVPVVMNVFNRVLGVKCEHCHVENAMEKADKPQFETTRKMFRMRGWIASQFNVNVTCWSCHHGDSKPTPPAVTAKAPWPASLRLEREDQPARSVYKNLKFFNSSAKDIQTSMLNISAALGVGCDHCHVEAAWESDDKPAKETARKMLALVRDTRAQYAGVRVSCVMCHRGTIKPETNPPA